MMFFLVLVMLESFTATPTDMTGKMFIFPQATSTAHVKLFTSRQDFSAVTVCFRSFTELRRDHSLFSLATPSSDNAVLIFNEEKNDCIGLGISSVWVDFNMQNYKLNSWSSICGTWESASGLGQLWINGTYSIKKFISTSNIKGPPIIILGQEQDSYGGGFDHNQSFFGMMSDVHMWDYVLSPCEIHNYVNDLSFSPGNVLNWGSLDFQITDRVLIEQKQKTCQ